MDHAFHFWTVLILLFPASNIAAESKVTLTTTTPTIQQLLTPRLNLRCALEDTSDSALVIGRSISDNPFEHDTNKPLVHQSVRRSTSSTIGNAKYIISMSLYRDDEHIASISENDSARAVMNSSNISVTGAIPGTDGEEGFLDVNITYPTEAEIGNYSCRVTAKDGNNHTVVYSDSVDIDITVPSIIDLVHYVHDLQQEDLKNKADIAQLQQEDNLKQTEIAKLQQDNSRYQDEIVNLQQEDTRQQTEINKLQQENNICNAKVETLETNLYEMTHIEGNVIHFAHLGLNFPSTKSQHVSFTKPYSTSPMVHLAVMEAGSNKEYHSEFYVKLIGVDTKGFTVELSINGQGSAYWLDHLTLSWLSVPN